jgi:hypothetical protein
LGEPVGRAGIDRRWRRWTMAQLILIAIFVLAGYYGYRSFLREAERVTARVRRAEKEAQNRSSGTLVQDPETGEYRLAED